ncbi:hypothetical protein K443DRAFT_4067 [Laccaria amethystina LaAM-08-1]|uniref:SAP domain-containing protein n=1 Tax=Laccaria amethystina LaAM-08-1 TaxID=1095629 RepID=A0A0C9XTR6_9AGAR|nr:hypothetical protein K443DRAFT_4067 [Laccaria amethystina LaAM-08-1]
MNKDWRKLKQISKSNRQNSGQQPRKRVFKGALGSKNKTELEDIADALELPIDGTKEDLKGHINAYFEHNPSKKEDPRYVGIFNSSRGQKRAAPPNKNSSGRLATTAEPPTQRRRLNESESNPLGAVTNTYTELMSMTPAFHQIPTSFTAPTHTPSIPATSFPSSSHVRLEDLPRHDHTSNIQTTTLLI